MDETCEKDFIKGQFSMNHTIFFSNIFFSLQTENRYDLAQLRGSPCIFYARFAYILRISQRIQNSSSV